MRSGRVSARANRGYFFAQTTVVVHAAATARTRLDEHLRRRRIDLDLLLGRKRGQTQELTRLRDRLGAIAAGEQTVVADAMEPLSSKVPA
jgi:hypothetical protein